MGRTGQARERIHAATASAAEHEGFTGWKRQVITQLIAETGSGRHVHVRRGQPTPEQPDALWIGPTGVIAFLLRDEPPARGGLAPAIAAAGALFAGARINGQVVGEAVVRPVLVLPAEHPATHALHPNGGLLTRSNGEHLTIGAHEVRRFLTLGDRRLNSRAASALAEHLDRRSDRHICRTMAAPEKPDAAAVELFSTEDVSQQRRDKALHGDFESWLTFLDDSQDELVKRNYNGPARISGPAGTGKSVVALHRLVRLAKRTTGPLLFTTFVKTLPKIVHRQFQQLAPELEGRVEFSTLHSWALRFLAEREIAIDIDQHAAENAYSYAWLKVGKPSKLNDLGGHLYWQQEIDRVIKGRGLRDEREYQQLARRGRGLTVAGEQRSLVWRLYEEYQKNLRDRGKHDFNDALIHALRELDGNGPDTPYSAVVVDEVQDITLVGLRLLGELGGTGPNGLLLVGDGQQQIYAGGCRLSDAGLPIRGRGEVLRKNYRNGAPILRHAQRIEAINRVDDLDGAAGFSLQDAEATLVDGEVVEWRGKPEEQETALLAALRGLTGVEPDDIAILTAKKSVAREWYRILCKADIDVVDLEEFEGERTGRIKVGTIHRAKGLEFSAVLVPATAEDAHSEHDEERRERDLRAALVAETRARDYLWLGGLTRCDDQN